MTGFTSKTILILCASILCHTAAFAAVPVVLLDGDRLTLDVKNQPLSTVLGMLSYQGIRIRIDPRINPQITATFKSRPIGAAMAGILRSVDYALIWRKDKATTPDEDPRLWEIRIFYKGQEGRIKPLKKNKNLAVVEDADGGYHVKDTLLLQLTPAMTESALAALLARLGATIIDAFPPLGIIQIRLPYGSNVPNILESLANYPGIRNAEPDYVHALKGGFPEKRDPFQASPLPSRSPYANATPIAVLDSGLLTEFVDSPYVKAAYDAFSPGDDIGDSLGHGTQMALIASGAVNPLGADNDAGANSQVVAIRAFDDNGYTSTYTLLHSIDYAAANGARVVSMSWGSNRSSHILDATIEYAASKGMILIAAAGNDPTGDPVYPAAYDNVIGVGALAADGKPWNQSNYGDFVSLSAPGVADLPVGYQGTPGTYAGTSIAAAYTARRVAAILDQTPNADREKIINLLLNRE
jgi:hypothetical protein